MFEWAGNCLENRTGKLCFHEYSYLGQSGSQHYYWGAWDNCLWHAVATCWAGERATPFSVLARTKSSLKKRKNNAVGGRDFFPLLLLQTSRDDTPSHSPFPDWAAALRSAFSTRHSEDVHHQLAGVWGNGAVGVSAVPQSSADGVEQCGSRTPITEKFRVRLQTATCFNPAAGGAEWGGASPGFVPQVNVINPHFQSHKRTMRNKEVEYLTHKEKHSCSSFCFMKMTDAVESAGHTTVSSHTLRTGAQSHLREDLL